jgi:hypothetical protein
MNFKCAAVAAIGALAVAFGSAAQAMVVVESESNNTIATAQNIDAYFSLDADADIADALTIPHATVVGGPGDGTWDYFQFTVANAGVTGVFDIDYALSFYPTGFDSDLALFDVGGGLLAQNDDADTSLGAGGSFHRYDSFLRYTFANAGQYFVRVGNYPGVEQSGGGGYELQVSLPGHALAGAPGAVPEPATWAMMLVGFFGAGAALRRRRYGAIRAAAAA